MAAGRQLPAHIRAQLASAGRAEDTGGQAWAGRNLGEGTSHTHQYPGDDGLVPASLEEAMDRFRAGEAPEESVVDALREVRLFAAVVAEVSHTEITADGLVSDKEADMALVSVQAPDGRKALPVFSHVQALTRWHPQARPVAAQARKIALSAVEDENQLLVLDPGSEVPFVLRRPALWALAKGERWMPSYNDARIQQALEACAATVPEIRRVRTAPGRGVSAQDAQGRVLAGGGPGPELETTLFLRPGLDQASLDQALRAFQGQVGQNALLAQSVDSMELKLQSAAD